MFPSPALLLLLCLPASVDVDLEYDRGMALARAQRWEEAEAAFEDGQRKAPQDKRFPLELAGIAFKRQNYSAARTHLKQALALDPRDAYANDFSATLYFLDGNLEAALKYWNRAGKPRIENIAMAAEPRLDPVLLDRAFTFSRASVLERRDLLTTQARLEALEIFPSQKFELMPGPEQTFDLLFRAVERSGWGDNPLEGLLGLFRGIPYRTVHPEFFNLGRSALNVRSLIRWDAQKRRAFTSLSAPLGRDPKWRYGFYLDGRKENWDLGRTFHAPAAALADLFLEKVEAGGEIQSTVSGRWGWRSGVQMAHRRFRNLTAPVFADGFSLKHRAQLDYQFLRIPERRLVVASVASSEMGRMFAPGFGAFSKLEGAVEVHWFPIVRGEDYETVARYRAGKTFGRAPFDELYILGLERDNDLWLRAHLGTHHGKKGNAPLGRDFLLLNWETDKIAYKHSFFRVTLGPFLDAGTVYATGEGFGSQKWLWDAGVQCKVRATGGLTVSFSYGKDLRSGRNAFYTWVSRGRE